MQDCVRKCATTEESVYDRNNYAGWRCYHENDPFYTKRMDFTTKQRFEMQFLSRLMNLRTIGEEIWVQISD